MAYTYSQLFWLASEAGFSLGYDSTMAAIALAESSGDPSAVNSSSGATGLWQINQPVWVRDYPGWTTTWLKNPQNNAKAAKIVFDKQGLGAWTTYTSGAYKKYIPKDKVPGPAGAYVGPDAKTVPSPGEALSGAVDTASSVASSAATGAESLVKGAAWLSNPANWVRVIYVVGGAAVILGGIAYLSKGTAINVVAGQAIKAIKKGNK